MMILNTATEALCEGTVLAGNVLTKSGELLAKEGDVITVALIKKLQHFSIDSVLVYMNGEKEEAALNAHKKRTGAIIEEEDFPRNLRELLQKNGRIEVRILLNSLNEAIRKLEEKEKVHSILEEIRVTQKALWEHMVSVAILALLLSRWLGCSKDEEETAALAGLLHDIGLHHLIEERKTAFLFKNELEVHGYEKHVTDGNHLLKSLKIPAPVIKAVLAHHERIDGRGFPLKIIGAQINKIGRIVAIADEYDTYTMKRHGEYAWTVLKALQKLEMDGSHRVDSDYVQVFIENMIELIQMRMVGLSDGTTGRLVMINKYDLLYPVVECKGKMIDLSVKRKLYVEELL